MPGIFSHNNPHKVFKKLERDFLDFYKKPSEDGIFGIIFPLYHLREWICPSGYSSYRGKCTKEMTREEPKKKSAKNI